jgi:hypothetical protein
MGRYDPRVKGSTSRPGFFSIARILALYLIAIGAAYGIFIGGAWGGIHSSALRQITLTVSVMAAIHQISLDSFVPLLKRP